MPYRPDKLTRKRLSSLASDMTVAALNLLERAPQSRHGRNLTAQVARSARNAGAQYRRAWHSLTLRRRVAHLRTSWMLCAEVLQWLDLLEDTGTCPAGHLADVRHPATDLLEGVKDIYDRSRRFEEP
jgi:four helix bundle protein